MNESGYTLKQLLSWCVEDRLIDEYKVDDSSIEICRGDEVNTYTRPDAVIFLKDLFRVESESVGQADPQLR